MKKVMLPILLAVALHASAQTYKQETVFTDNAPTKTFLSHLKNLESSSPTKNDTFSLWGYQLYFDNRNAGTYEVEYFKGNAKETYQFLNQVVEFSNKYKDEENVLTNIMHVQVKVSKYFGFKYTLVYDRDRKVTCKLNQKQWISVLSLSFGFYQKREADKFEQMAQESEQKAIEMQTIVEQAQDMVTHQRMLAEEQRLIAEANLVEAIRQKQLSEAKLSKK
jgi:hypothetical protein